MIAKEKEVMPFSLPVEFLVVPRILFWLLKVFGSSDLRVH